MSRVDEKLTCADCGDELRPWDVPHPADAVTLCAECLETWVRGLSPTVTFSGAEKFGRIDQPQRDGRPVFWFHAVADRIEGVPV